MITKYITNDLFTGVRREYFDGETREYVFVHEIRDGKRIRVMTKKKTGCVEMFDTEEEAWQDILDKTACELSRARVRHEKVATAILLRRQTTTDGVD